MPGECRRAPRSGGDRNRAILDSTRAEAYPRAFAEGGLGE